MPVPVWTPPIALGAHGTQIEFPVLAYILYDLRVHEHISIADYADMVYWVNSYRDGGALPGARLFLSPLSAEMVTFPYLISHLSEMWQIATNWMDLTDSEEENDPLTGNIEVDLFQPWPVDIGRVCHYSRFAWVQ